MSHLEETFQQETRRAWLTILAILALWTAAGVVGWILAERYPIVHAQDRPLASLVQLSPQEYVNPASIDYIQFPVDAVDASGAAYRTFGRISFRGQSANVSPEAEAKLRQMLGAQ